ncbi:MAG: Phosphate transport system substrate-binding protein [Verrucomicrobia bacterium]|nr:Phosphate transport system substrate-binding protein [Verrucomicrobiota bacterium]
MKKSLLSLAALTLTLTSATFARASADDSLPVYQKPAGPNKGILRVFGAGLHGLVKEWEAGYMKQNPDVKIADNPGGSDAAIGVLQHGTAEIAVFGREMELNDYLGFFENKGYNPTELTIASGTYDVPGASWGLIIFVNKDNPLAQLTMKQLDGIFGSERTGAYNGYEWLPDRARPAKDNIRTWGQLGLTGEWAGQEIQTYGYANGGMAHFFEIEVLQGSNKWNGNYRQYVENGTKILVPGRESAGVLAMLGELEKDKYGIGWAGMPQWNQVPQVKGIKAIALSRTDGGPFVAPSKATFESRAYPLTRSVYIYLDKEPGRPLSPKVKDFLKYILSEEGQAIVRKHCIYFALPPEVVSEQLKKLD